MLPRLLLCAILGLCLSAEARAAPDPPVQSEPPPALPPLLSILSPADGAEVAEGQVTVRLTARSQTGDPIGSVRVLLDGQVVTQTRGLLRPEQATATEQDATYTLVVAMPRRDCTLSVVAETDRAKSEPVAIRLRWKGRPGGLDLGPVLPIQPRLYVLSIGVSRYRRADIRLRYPAKDARDLAALFARQAGRLYRSVETRVLADDQATKDRVLDALQWLQRQTTSRDVALLFLAGHGITDPGTGTYYYLPYDADLDAIKRTMVSDADLRTTMASIAGKAVLFLDTCHAGKVLSGLMTRGIDDVARFVRELTSAENGVVVFAAATTRQAALEDPAWGNGVFTKAVLEGLRGLADDRRSGRVTINMLDLYVSERVKELTGGMQSPSTAKPSTVPDFPLAIPAGPIPAAARPSRERAPPRAPLYRRWWLWTAIGTVVAGAVVAGAVLATRPQEETGGSPMPDLLKDVPPNNRFPKLEF